jgi:hypothetical protein
MTVERDPDAILAAWLEEGPTRLPDATRRAIAVNTRTNRQTWRPMRVPWRDPSMNPLARMAVAAIAIALAIGGAVYVFAPYRGAPAGGSPAGSTPALAATPAAVASASPAVASASPVVPSASPVPSTAAVTLAPGGEVFPGRYRPQFDPPLAFTIDREVQHNCAPGFKCRGSIDENRPGWLDIEFGLPRIEVSLIRVDKVKDPAKPNRLIDAPADLVAWIANHPGVTVTARKPVTIGGVAGTELDLKTGASGVTFGPITGVADPPFGVGPNDVAQIIIVDVQGHHVVIGMRAEDGSLDEIRPLVDSIVWG